MHSESLPRLKAPRDHGAILAYPPLTEAGSLLAANAARLESATVALQGQPLRDLRRLARTEAIGAARDYLAEAGEPVPALRGDAVLLAGHQPELFHPGVWIKNFALQSLAKQHRAVPLNLVIDNDAVKATALRVPHDTQVVKAPFDSWQSDAPCEDRVVQDEELFASLPSRVEPLVRDWPFRPLLLNWWPEVLRQRRRTPLLGERLAAGRRSLERAWGRQPLEVPLSRVCQTESFAWFAIHLLRDLPRFHADYNAAVRGYRQRHGLRSPMHPAPDLAQEGPWLEAPFWAWRSGELRRQRFWAKSSGGNIELRAGPTLWPTLQGDAVRQIQQWRTLVAAGHKVRTRALTTTLFSRLLLGNLFVHGIGGGKYDEVTDELFRQFFGLEAPAYLVLTATLQLPLAKFPTAHHDYLHSQRLERDVFWNPQRHLDGQAGDGVSSLIREKENWIRLACANHDERKHRLTELRSINKKLHALAGVDQTRMRQALADAERRMRLHELHSSREYAFCLFPEEMLREFYQRTLG
jgi:hypothetical protein